MTWPEFTEDLKLGNVDQLLSTALRELAIGRDVLQTISRTSTVPLKEARSRFMLQTAVNILCGYNLSTIARGVRDVAHQQLASDANNHVNDAYESGTELRPIAYLNIEAYRYISGKQKIFPGERSKEFIEQSAGGELFEDYPVYKRLITGSDRDLAKLYMMLPSLIGR
jgi:hypothetical protein